MAQYKYGRLPAKHDPRTPRFAHYTGPVLPQPPESCDWSKAVQTWPMMGNDRIGDCTCAAAGHLIQSWSSNADGTATAPTEDQVINAYASITGYDPKTGSGDNGASELDVLNYWRTTGIAGNRISGFVEIDPMNSDHVRQAVLLFGGAYLGIDMPRSAEDQFEAGQPWAPDGWFDPIVGGHAVPIVGYDAQHLKVITWGRVQLMTWDFLGRYCEEAYCILDPCWLSTRTLAWYERPFGDALSPGGFNLAQLRVDLAALAG
jgi:hypothetical protein